MGCIAGGCIGSAAGYERVANCISRECSLSEVSLCESIGTIGTTVAFRGGKLDGWNSITAPNRQPEPLSLPKQAAAAVVA